MSDPRFFVGIDLGTTNTVVAYSEVGVAGPPTILPIPQPVSATELAARELLPSVLYAPLPGEAEAIAAGLPAAERAFVGGAFASRRGAETEGRTVISAKSWLAYAGVDRLAPILPWAKSDDETDVPRISPVDASARYLRAIGRAWDAAFPDAPLADQRVMLTLPASFDEAARELTVLAAKRAGLAVDLLEEPQAAFYAFADAAGPSELAALRQSLGPGGLVLVCDVGGGTTDFSLVRLEDDGARTKLTRVAVGEHLLLGGDNMDLALAHRLERDFDAGGLAPARFSQLVSACRDAKERLLGAAPPDEIAVTLAGRGSRLVGGTQRTHLRRADAETLLLDGYFPFVDADERPARARAGLVGLGLPYARDPAITRHLAAFLAPHRDSLPGRIGLLLNGGVFHSPALRARVAEVIATITDAMPIELPHADPDRAVARGAAIALRGELRIGGGSARSFYVGVEGGRALCVVPRGAERGERTTIDRPLSLVVGAPARFDLLASRLPNDDAPGDVVAIDEGRFEPLPPAFASFRGERGETAVDVNLEAEISRIGTLEIACVERAKPTRRFRLSFRLEGDGPASIPPPSRGPDRRLPDAQARIARAFADRAERDAKDLLRDLERLFGERGTWTTETSRALVDATLPFARARRLSPAHERAFFGLVGYALRPGFGAPGDDERTRALAPLFAESARAATDPRSAQTLFVAYRRVAGGLDEAAQRELAAYAITHLLGGKKGQKSPPKEAAAELWALATFLERASRDQKLTLGAHLVERTYVDHDRLLWEHVARLGARVPTYASAHLVLPPRDVEPWIDDLLREKWSGAELARVAVALARRTGDRARDVSEPARASLVRRLRAVNAPAGDVRALEEVVAVSSAERALVWGETLPVGLRLG